MVKHSMTAASTYFTTGYRRCRTIIARIPLLSRACTSWEYATSAFSCEQKKYRIRQQWKSFLIVLINPRFSNYWFEILTSPGFISIASQRKDLYLKPYRVYMSVRWTKHQRAKVIQDTYRFLAAKGGNFANNTATGKSLEIARFMLKDSMEGVLLLGYDYRYRKEGEMVLSFRCEQLGGTIAAAAFSFEEFSKEEWACRIACIQGHAPNSVNPSKEAQKLLHGLRPKSLMIFTLQEFSRQIGCSAVFGASDAIQAYRRKHVIHLPWRHNIRFDYNAIWKESGGCLQNDGWFKIPMIPLHRDDSQIKANKRASYHRRYNLLESISDKIANAVKQAVS